MQQCIHTNSSKGGQDPTVQWRANHHRVCRPKGWKVNTPGKKARKDVNTQCLSAELRSDKLKITKMKSPVAKIKSSSTSLIYSQGRYYLPSCFLGVGLNLYRAVSLFLHRRDIRIFRLAYYSRRLKLARHDIHQYIFNDF